VPAIAYEQSTGDAAGRRLAICGHYIGMAGQAESRPVLRTDVARRFALRPVSPNTRDDSMSCPAEYCCIKSINARFVSELRVSNAISESSRFSVLSSKACAMS
jgi:hypothetical protein